MANSTAAFNPELWYPRMQSLLYKDLVGLKIANLEMSESVQYGDKIHKPYGHKLIVEARTKMTDMSPQDYTATDESFDIDQIYGVMVNLDKVDSRQSRYNLESDLAENMQNAMNRHIDSIILGEYANAHDDIYNDDIGGSGSTTACAVNSGNVQRLFIEAQKKLSRQNVPLNNLFAVVGPSIIADLQLYLSNKDTAYGDQVGMNGFVGTYLNFGIYLSNNLTWTGTWTPANNPSNAGTITINGVTITFKSSLSGSAGEVLIGGDTATTLDNLVALINDPLDRNSSANYAGFSVTNAAKLAGCVATDGTTAMTIVFKGGGECTVATSDSNDPWSVQVTHALFGRKRATDMCLQIRPNITFNQEPKQPQGCGNYVGDFLYGYKTLAQKAYELLDANIDASNY